MFITELSDPNNISKDAICVLPISVGQGYHEGERFKATLEVVNAKFSECYIIISDTLQRHTLMMDSPNDNEETILQKAKQLGKEWLDKVKESINSTLTIPVVILFWDELTSPEVQQKCEATFTQKYSQIDKYINWGALLFTKAHHKKAKKDQNQVPPFEIIDTDQAQQHSRAYIKEELTKFTSLKEWPSRRDFKTKSDNGLRKVHFCYPFEGNDVAERVIYALKILLDDNPNVIFTNLYIKLEPKPKKNKRPNEKDRAEAIPALPQTSPRPSPTFFNAMSKTSSSPSPTAITGNLATSSPIDAPPKSEKKLGAFHTVLNFGIYGTALTQQAAANLALILLNLYRLEEREESNAIDQPDSEQKRSNLTTNSYKA